MNQTNQTNQINQIKQMKHLNDHELESTLTASVGREREAIAEVLRCLREVEARNLYATRGYPSLFAYCTDKLKYSEPEAMLRIQSMRLMRAVPDVEEKIERGALSMSVAAQIQNASRREKLPAATTRALVQELTGVSKRDAEKKLAERFPEAPSPEKIRPLGAELIEIRFTISKEEASLLERLLDRRAHSNFDRKYRELFMALVSKELKKIEEGPRPRQLLDTAPQRPDVVRARYISAQIRRFIWKRDQGRCQYQDPITGQKCPAIHGLQIDHIHPYAEGGTHAPDNLRLLCGTHNRLRPNPGQTLN